MSADSLDGTDFDKDGYPLINPSWLPTTIAFADESSSDAGKTLYAETKLKLVTPLHILDGGETRKTVHYLHEDSAILELGDIHIPPPKIPFSRAFLATYESQQLITAIKDGSTVPAWSKTFIPDVDDSKQLDYNDVLRMIFFLPCVTVSTRIAELTCILFGLEPRESIYEDFTLHRFDGDGNLNSEFNGVTIGRIEVSHIVPINVPNGPPIPTPVHIVWVTEVVNALEKWYMKMVLKAQNPGIIKSRFAFFKVFIEIVKILNIPRIFAVSFITLAAEHGIKPEPVKWSFGMTSYVLQAPGAVIREFTVLPPAINRYSIKYKSPSVMSCKVGSMPNGQHFYVFHLNSCFTVFLKTIERWDLIVHSILNASIGLPSVAINTVLWKPFKRVVERSRRILSLFVENVLPPPSHDIELHWCIGATVTAFMMTAACHLKMLEQINIPGRFILHAANNLRLDFLDFVIYYGYKEAATIVDRITGLLFPLEHLLHVLIPLDKQIFAIRDGVLDNIELMLTSKDRYYPLTYHTVIELFQGVEKEIAEHNAHGNVLCLENILYLIGLLEEIIDIYQTIFENTISTPAISVWRHYTTQHFFANMHNAPNYVFWTPGNFGEMDVVRQELHAITPYFGIFASYMTDHYIGRAAAYNVDRLTLQQAWEELTVIIACVILPSLIHDAHESAHTPILESFPFSLIKVFIAGYDCNDATFPEIKEADYMEHQIKLESRLAIYKANILESQRSQAEREADADDSDDERLNDPNLTGGLTARIGNYGQIPGPTRKDVDSVTVNYFKVTDLDNEELNAAMGFPPNVEAPPGLVAEWKPPEVARWKPAGGEELQEGNPGEVPEEQGFRQHNREEQGWGGL
jgi:hypothetical protein